MNQRIRVLQELGEEFERISQQPANAHRSDSGRRRWVRAPRAATAGLGVGLSVLVVVAVVAVFVTVGGTSRHRAPAGGGVRIVLQAEPTGQTPVVTQAAMSRTVRILRERLGTVFRDVRITQSGANQVAVVADDGGAGSRARIVALSTTSPELYFYDWETNVLTPNGKTVASQLQAQNPAALRISQGAGSSPGGSGAGGLPLYQAVKLASKQPAAPLSPHLSRTGPQYYLFGALGSAACATAAKANGTTVIHSDHCLLSGPANTVRDLTSGLPTGVSMSEGQLLTVAQGTVVLQAANLTATGRPTDHVLFFDSPSAEFFVLKDNVAIPATDITHPQQSTDPGGNPDVAFDFDSTGQKEFQKVTAQVAKRGASLDGNMLNQHFAIALDTQLITVPSIDSKQYPHGVPGGGGADIGGAFTSQSARQLAMTLRLGPLPVRLTAP